MIVINNFSGETHVKIAELKAKAKKIEAEAELQKKVGLQNAELENDTAFSELEIKRARELSEIESKKFEDMIQAIGSKTIVAMAEVNTFIKILIS